MPATLIPRDGRALVLANGACGQRAARILRQMGRGCDVIDTGDYLPPRGAEVAARRAADPGITHVVGCHGETSGGILNPLAQIVQATQGAGRCLLIVSMSAFGAVPVMPSQIGFNAVVSSANKCNEDFPPTRRDMLAGAAGNATSLSLDAHAQWAELGQSGQWRFAPPTHAVAAFLQALDEHAAEGAARGTRRALCRQP